MNALRVISGKYKDKPLLSPEGKDVRPTSGRVKESLFNIIQFRIAEKKVLDIFCGTGQMGIEALSRGAAGVTFIDGDTSLLLQNLKRCGIGEEAEVIKGQYATILARLSGMERRYNIIFADPPYAAGYYESIIKIAPALLASGGMLILEHNTANPIIESDRMKISDIRRYGSRSLTFLTEE